MTVAQVDPPPPGGHWWSLAPVPASERISPARAYTEALGVYLVFFGASIVAAAGSLAGSNPPNPEGWWVTGESGFDQVAQSVLAVALVVLLAARRGRRPADVGLAARARRGGPGLRQCVRMAAWAAVAFLVGSGVTSALASGGYPFGHPNPANTTLELVLSVNAGVLEEVVVLGFLVTTLEQAGRPRLEIAAVALLCRAAYHIYYGPGVVGILVWAAVFLWLFWRFRSIVPMLLAHVGWDALVFLGQLSSDWSWVLVLAILVLVVVAVTLWLADRPVARDPWGTGGWGQPVSPLGQPGGAPAGGWGQEGFQPGVSRARRRTASRGS